MSCIHPLKTPVGKNRRYDICTCVDSTSLKTFDENQESKLIKGKRV